MSDRNRDEIDDEKGWENVSESHLPLQHDASRYILNQNASLGNKPVLFERNDRPPIEVGAMGKCWGCNAKQNRHEPNYTFPVPSNSNYGVCCRYIPSLLDREGLRDSRLVSQACQQSPQRRIGLISRSE